MAVACIEIEETGERRLPVAASTAALPASPPARVASCGGAAPGHVLGALHRHVRHAYRRGVGTAPRPRPGDLARPPAPRRHRARARHGLSRRLALRPRAQVLVDPVEHPHRVVSGVPDLGERLTSQRRRVDPRAQRLASGPADLQRAPIPVPRRDRVGGRSTHLSQVGGFVRGGDLLAARRLRRRWFQYRPRRAAPAHQHRDGESEDGAIRHGSMLRPGTAAGCRFGGIGQP